MECGHNKCFRKRTVLVIQAKKKCSQASTRSIVMCRVVSYPRVSFRDPSPYLLRLICLSVSPSPCSPHKSCFPASSGILGERSDASSPSAPLAWRCSSWLSMRTPNAVLSFSVLLPVFGAADPICPSVSLTLSVFLIRTTLMSNSSSSGLPKLPRLERLTNRITVKESRNVLFPAAD